VAAFLHRYSIPAGVLLFCVLMLGDIRSASADLVGTGVVVVDVDASGKVTAVRIEKSLGNAKLDQAARATFRKWHFKPGTAPHVKIPVTFKLK